MEQIAACSRGMIYCVARLGVTGYHTIFSDAFDQYLARVRSVTDLPIGVGFGVQTRADVEHLTGRADVAIVCTQAVKIAHEQGAAAAAGFLKGLRD
jgi:tryptophan synthase alpha chain